MPPPQSGNIGRAVFDRGDRGTCLGHWTLGSPLLELIQTSLGGMHLILNIRRAKKLGKPHPPPRSRRWGALALELRVLLTVFRYKYHHEYGVSKKQGHGLLGEVQ